MAIDYSLFGGVGGMKVGIEGRRCGCLFMAASDSTVSLADRERKGVVVGTFFGWFELRRKAS